MWVEDSCTFIPYKIPVRIWIFFKEGDTLYICICEEHKENVVFKILESNSGSLNKYEQNQMMFMSSGKTFVPLSMSSFFLLAAACRILHPPTRSWTCALSSESMEVLTTGPPGDCFCWGWGMSSSKPLPIAHPLARLHRLRFLFSVYLCNTIHSVKPTAPQQYVRHYMVYPQTARVPFLYSSICDQHRSSEESDGNSRARQKGSRFSKHSFIQFTFYPTRKI